MDRSLGRKGIDRLDLWQVHDVKTREDLAVVYGRVVLVKPSCGRENWGKTRFMGVTGHHDPEILAQAMRQWPVDVSAIFSNAGLRHANVSTRNTNRMERMITAVMTRPNVAFVCFSSMFSPFALFDQEQLTLT